MRSARPGIPSTFLAVAICGLLAVVPAAAQTSLGRARVSAANATIYARCDTSSPARAVITRGTEVSVEAVNEGWVSVFVEVIGERGCLKRSELEASREIDRAGDARRARDIERTRAENPMPGGNATRQPARRAVPSGPPLAVSAYGSAGLFTATAIESFDAILDTHSGPDLGGGIQVAWRRGPLRGIFVQADVSRFEKTGERVFVDGNDVFPLGIPLTITLTPLEVSAGYRGAAGRRGGAGGPVSYFAGGGVGTLRYREADDDAQVTDSFVSYHVMGGADVRVWGPLFVGGEARYRWVPDSLGVGGVSEAFTEKDLGGTTFRVRVGVTF
jgi:hypothetical protein